MAIMIGNNNSNSDAFRSLSFLNQNRIANQRNIQSNSRFDAFNSLSLINQNRITAQRELQRTATTRLDDNDAIDNVSAYSIEESLRIRTQVLGQVNKNIQDDTALLKTAQSRGGAIVDSIKEIQKLAISATDEALTDDDRRVIQKDINRLVEQIVSDSQITFNGRKLIDGSATTGNPATATVLSNNSLYSDTTADTALTDLKNTSGANLGIDASDRITASYVKDGNIYTINFSVGNNTLEDIFVNLNKINGMTLTEATFVGGGRGILVEPVEPIKPEEPVRPTEPIKPTAPDKPTIERPNEVTEPVAVVEPAEVSMPTIVPSEVEIAEPTKPDIIRPDIKDFDNADDHEAAMTDYNTAMENYAAQMEQYELDKAAYEAIQAEARQAGAETIQKPTDTNDPKYQSDLDAYNAAVDNFKNYVQYRKDKETYDQYQTDLATYNQYLTDKAAYDQAWADYNAADAQYRVDIADYENNLYPQYLRDTEKYENELYPQYLDNMATYRLEYAQYQKDMANYRLMTADIVQSDDNGLSVTARKPGLDEQISGVSINVTDSSGNAKSAANAALNNFRTTTYAANARDDNSVYFQIGETIDEVLNFGFNDMRAEAFGLKGANGNIISISTKEDADAALATINNALSKAIEQVQTIGYSEKKLGYIADALSNEISNIQEPDLMVRNADRAKTLTLYTLDFFQRDRMQSMLAMANQHSSAVLGLLR